ncbi:Uncharacterized protein Adt_11551 [Abeliophyllum distichum]|uniref:Reverse transcriptase n=1 Tax=Abeliophyllum distichum TaxID=126358 RepID=A0ABD1UN49_9LAMI
MYIDMKIKGKPIKAMVNTSATHNYLASPEVEHLGLVLEKGSRKVKAINLVAQPIARVAKSVLIKRLRKQLAVSQNLLEDFYINLRMSCWRKLPRKFLPRRSIDHEIELILGAKPHAMAPYHIAQPKLEELKKQLTEMLDSGIIMPAKSSNGAPVLFQKKADGFLRMCCDYRALNKITIKIVIQFC